jgi:hypothetical protein
MKNILSALAIVFFLIQTALGAEPSIAPTSNTSEPTAKIRINYPSQNGCSFMYSPVNYCDTKHIEIINKALRETPPNFYNKYIIVKFPERLNYHQRSIAVINSQTGDAYPLPIDAYSGTDGKASLDGEVSFSTSSNKLCIEGDILVYRATSSGKFCWTFDGEKFIGHTTEYME